ncbi:hypothetical protein F511_32122 [Dorcoceras hygrometricum]|uniref:Uncharacterized protein n=1 Tax=Dorcoceras hygrometricum TaxID=472368 RepID=A0A2Z7A9S6_9LAMI|nr:hypothetical protein F511_32122 [Dorcoceras hygrometricum]
MNQEEGFSIHQCPTFQRSRRGGIISSAEIIWLHKLARGSSSALQARPTLPRSGDLPRTGYEIGFWPEYLCSDRHQEEGFSIHQCPTFPRFPTWLYHLVG